MKEEKMRDTLETAHDKELEMIDTAAKGAKVKSEEIHTAKMAAFDKAASALRSATKAAAEKKVVLGAAVAKRAADVTETAGMKASDLGEKATQIKMKTTKKAQNMPWLAPMAGVVLLLALALSVGKRLRVADSFDI